MKLTKNLTLSLAFLILAPSMQKPLRAEISEHILPLAVAGSALVCIGCGIIFFPKKVTDNVKGIRKLISQIEYAYSQELDIVKKYDSQRSFFNYGKYNRENQENLRADLVEQTLGRTNGSSAYPLHMQVQQMSKLVEELQTKINLLKSCIKTIDKKLDSSWSTKEKQALLQEKDLYLRTIAECETFKKRLQTIKGALMRSSDFKEETYFAQFNKSWFSSKPNVPRPQPSQPQSAAHR